MSAWAGSSRSCSAARAFSSRRGGDGKSGQPGSRVWDWLSTYFLDILPRYTTYPPFGKAEARRLVRHWRKAANDPTSLLIGPALLDVVGRKPRR